MGAQLLQGKAKIKRWLTEKTVEDVGLARGRVIELGTDTPVQEAFQVLIDNHILSAPVWDEKTQKYIGFLDVRDLVKYAVFASDTSRSLEHLVDLLDHAAKAIKSPSQAINITYLARTQPFRPIDRKATLLDVANVLATGIHRVPVVGENGKVVNIISQSSIIAEINEHLTDEDILPEEDAKCNEMSIDYLGESLMSCPVLSASTDDQALSMFKTMESKNLSGVAVIDESGKLVGQSTSSDLKYWLKTHQSLQLPVMDFLAKIRQTEAGDNILFPTISASPKHSLYYLIARLVAVKLHRIFVVDDKQLPVGVVSITDILRLVTDTKKRVRKSIA